MILIPMLFDDLWDDCLDSPFRSSQIGGKHLERQPFTDSFVVSFENRPCACCCSRSKQYTVDDKDLIAKDEEKPTTDFEINLDVQEFKAEELSVTANSQFVIVEAKHEDNDDSKKSYVLRHFIRRYKVPDGYDRNKITSTLSSDGVLTISAPKLELPESTKEHSPSDQIDAEKSSDTKQEEHKPDQNFTLEDLDE